MTTTAAVTNPQVGEKIGIGHTGVSRLRSGDRSPSIETMIAIEEAYSWPIGEQIRARRQGKKPYAEAFEAVLASHYGTINAQPTPAS